MSVPAGFIVTKGSEATKKAADILTTPIWGRTTTMVWDLEEEEWVPDTQERSVSVTPAAVLAVGAAAVGIGGALWLMGARAKVLSTDERAGIKNATVDGTKQREAGIKAAEERLEAAQKAQDPQAIALSKEEVKTRKADLRAWKAGRIGERIPFRWAQRNEAILKLFG